VQFDLSKVLFFGLMLWREPGSAGPPPLPGALGSAAFLNRRSAVKNCAGFYLAETSSLRRS